MACARHVLAFVLVGNVVNVAGAVLDQHAQKHVHHGQRSREDKGQEQKAWCRQLTTLQWSFAASGPLGSCMRREH